MFHLCFCLTLVCVVVVSAAAALPEDATTWTTHQVSEWVDTLHSADAVAMKRGVAKYHITGNILMMIDTSDLEFELGVSSSLERKRILAAVDQLKDSFSENNVVLDFWELRALNRKMVDYSTPLLTTAPRWAITTFDDYPSYCTPLKTFGQGQHWVVAWVEWLLFPECKDQDPVCVLECFFPSTCIDSLCTHIHFLVLFFFVLSCRCLCRVHLVEQRLHHVWAAGLHSLRCLVQFSNLRYVSCCQYLQRRGIDESSVSICQI